MLRSLACAVVLVVVGSNATRAQDYSVPPTDGSVKDSADLLTAAERTNLAELIRTIDERDQVHLAVLTLSDTRGADPKTIAVAALNGWNAGRRSVLLLVCLSPRQLYIQPGTDLQGLFDEATASAICRETVAPLLRASRPGDAIQAGLTAIVARVRGGAAPAPATSSSSAAPFLLGVAGLAALVGGFVVIRGALARKCRRCGESMRSSSRTVDAATYSCSGRGETTYWCAPCGVREVMPYSIAQLTYASSSWDSSSSSSSYSDGGSSSSGSCDGGGGGGSSW